jgi:hypothetical protein
LVEATTRSVEWASPQQDSDRVRGQQLDAVTGEPIEEIDDVVVVDQGVGQLDERSDHQRLAPGGGLGHRRSLLSVLAIRCPR